VLIHGNYKMLSNIEYILKYLMNTFPVIKEQMFDIEGENLPKLLTWYLNVLKPRCDILINMMIEKKTHEGKIITDDEKSREVNRFLGLLQKLDENLKKFNSDFFSGNDRISAIDVVLHSVIVTIVYMYSTKGRLSSTEYRYLSPWMERMSKIEVIERNCLEMK
jgi:hypothetical protein